MALPVASRCPFAPDLDICRVLNGMWQVSGAHGRIDPERAIDAMFAYHDAGFTTWDLADHYGPAEDLIGRFRASRRDPGLHEMGPVARADEPADRRRRDRGIIAADAGRMPRPLAISL